jgi:hypothetical protein
VQGRRQHCVDCPRRQFVGLGNEGRGGIIDQHVKGGVLPQIRDHDLGSLQIPQIAAFLRHIRLRQFGPKFSHRPGEHVGASAADDEPRTQFEEASSHASAGAGAARNENATASENARKKSTSLRRPFVRRQHQ